MAGTPWLIDKSALVRLAGHPDRGLWADRVNRGLVRISTVTRLEVGFSARNGEQLRTDAERAPLALMPVEYLTPAIEVAVARWRQLVVLTEQVDSLRERQAAREVVDRAKRLLEQRLGLSEPQAFAWLRRSAMDGRVTLAEAAAAALADPPGSAS